MDAPFSFNRSIGIGSRRDRITGDSGALTGRELLGRSGVVRFLAKRLPDKRDGRRIRHSQRRLARTLLLLAGQGRREHSDATALRDDPALRLATGDRAGTAPLGKAGRLPSQPTLSRRVAGWSAKEGVEVLREGLQRLAGWRLKAMGGWRRPETLVIDIDSLPVEVHGEQPGSAWNGYYHRRVYHSTRRTAGWGTQSAWTVVDADTVSVDNTNRCLLFFPKDAGWPDEAALHKVSCVATRVPNVSPLAQWYDEAQDPSHAYDTVVVLANEREVRTRVSVRNDPIQFQATTGRSWMSQLHRHIAGRDDCIRCRMNDIKDPHLACAVASVDGTGDSAKADAALPFLSAASGLMLVSALQRLQSGEVGACRLNTWRWDFRSTYEMVSVGRHRCQSGCSMTLPSAIRDEIANHTRWADSPWRTT